MEISVKASVKHACDLSQCLVQTIKHNFHAVLCQHPGSWKDLRQMREREEEADGKRGNNYVPRH